MNFEDVRIKLKRKNQILFSRDSECLQQLLALIRQQKHRTLVMWALQCALTPLDKLNELYPHDERGNEAIRLSEEWAKGHVKMPTAKKAILAIHGFAKEMNDPLGIALCHAIGQACATVHVESHAVGLVIYELTALVREYGLEHSEVLEKRIEEYITILKKWEKEIERNKYEFAPFLLDDSKPNKEMIVYLRGLDKAKNSSK